MAVKSDRNNLICFAPVAQLDRASGYGPEGREFESSPARQTKKFTPYEWAFLFCVIRRRRFEQGGSSKTNCNLSVNGCKARVRVGGVDAERIFSGAPKNKALLRKGFIFIQSEGLVCNRRQAYVIRLPCKRYVFKSQDLYVLFLRIDYIPPTVDNIHFFEMLTYRNKLRITITALP